MLQVDLKSPPDSVLTRHLTRGDVAGNGFLSEGKRVAGRRERLLPVSRPVRRDHWRWRRVRHRRVRRQHGARQVGIRGTTRPCPAPPVRRIGIARNLLTIRCYRRRRVRLGLAQVVSLQRSEPCLGRLAGGCGRRCILLGTCALIRTENHQLAVQRLVQAGLGSKGIPTWHMSASRQKQQTNQRTYDQVTTQVTNHRLDAPTGEAKAITSLCRLSA